MVGRRDLLLFARLPEGGAPSPDADPVGAEFHYNDYHPFLVGMILKQVAREPIAAYAERRLWQRMGAAYPASLTLDSRRHGFAISRRG